MKEKDKAMHIQIEPKLKKELQDEAKKKYLSLNAYVRILLLERKK